MSGVGRFSDATRQSALRASRWEGYSQKVLSIRPGERVAYWMLDEASGAQATDTSGRALHGTYNGVTLAQPGIGDGRTSAYLDGADSVLLPSASIAAAWNPLEGSLFGVLKVDPAAWIDATTRRAASMRSSSSNTVLIRRSTTNNVISADYTAGGVTVGQSSSDLGASTDFIFAGITWSKSADQMKFYVNGAQVGLTQTGLGVWAGTLNNCFLGAVTAAPSSPWLGHLAHWALWTVALTPAEIALLGSIS